MGVSVYKIKKWYKMITGNSISHVNQGEGKRYSKTDITGYYNDLTEKVTRDAPDILVPKYHVDTGEEIYFSIGIFQYGLGAYDLYIESNDEKYKEKVIACVEWAVDNQQSDGSWITFAYENKDHPYSSMAQGEGISLLLRAFLATSDMKYIECANRAFDYMITPIETGGTTKYIGDDVYFYECTEEPLILNGWIFSVWGIYDYWKFTKSETAKQLLDKTLATIEKRLKDFDLGYWSKYEDGKRICSPFYHKLHIVQLRVLDDLFENTTYAYYASRWDSYQRSFWKPKVAFIRKVIQKVFE